MSPLRYLICARRTLGTSVNERLQRLLAFVLVHHAHQRRVHPPPSFDRVQTGNDEVELLVERLGVILDLVEVS